MLCRTLGLPEEQQQQQQQREGMEAPPAPQQGIFMRACVSLDRSCATKVTDGMKYVQYYSTIFD